MIKAFSTDFLLTLDRMQHCDSTPSFTTELNYLRFINKGDVNLES